MFEEIVKSLKRFLELKKAMRTIADLKIYSGDYLYGEMKNYVVFLTNIS